MSATIIACAQAGSLDFSFSSDGLTTTDFGFGNDHGYSVAIQSDGKIVVAGISDNGYNDDFSLARYNGDGSLDNTFSTGGKVVTAIGNSEDEGFAVAIQSDGKIVMGGYYWNGSAWDWALVRYKSNGSLDNTFDNDGIVTTPNGSFDGYGYSIAIQSDNKIVLGGYVANALDIDLALLRYSSDGSLDATFGTGGKVTTAIGNGDDVGYSVAIQSDGKIVLAGYTFNGVDKDFALVRYNSDGTLDQSFDSDGKVITPVGSSTDQAYSVAIQPDGKIVAAGYTFNGVTNDFAVARYNSNGTLDNSFDSDGKVTTAVGISYEEATSVAIQSDGKILVAGNASISNEDFALVRYNSDGSLDNSFDLDGKVTTHFGGDANANSIVIQADGKIVLAGFSSNGNDDDFAVARYDAGTVGLDELTTDHSLLISPNPFTTELTVRGAVARGELQLFDVMGKEIIRQSRPGGTSETKINTEKLLPGFYLLNYLCAGKIQSQTMIKF